MVSVTIVRKQALTMARLSATASRCCRFQNSCSHGVGVAFFDKTGISEKTHAQCHVVLD